MPAAVLFDFNGVLVDDEHLHFEAFNEVLAPEGVRMTPETYAERYLGFDDRGAFAAVLRDHGRAPDEALISALIARKAEVYTRRAATDLRVFPGAAELVRRAAAACPVAVVSGALRAEIELALARMDVRHHVVEIVAAEDVAVCKPDPEGYRAALVRLGRRFPAVRAAGAVAIEDSLAGLEAACAAGVCAVAVAHTYAPDALRGSGARAVYPTVADITLADLDALLAR